MNLWPQIKEFRFVTIADSTGPFAGFKPYVASINNRGLVAFQAALKSGGTGLFAGDGASLTSAVNGSEGSNLSFYSHPDINNANTLTAYAATKESGQRVVRIEN